MQRFPVAGIFCPHSSQLVFMSSSTWHHLHHVLILKLLSRQGLLSSILCNSSHSLCCSASLLFHGLTLDPLLPVPLQHQCLLHRLKVYCLQFPPMSLFSRVLLYCCLAILRARKKGEEGHFWLITTSLGTSKPRPREELQPDVQNFPFGLLKLLTKFDKLGINLWKTSEINPGFQRF